LSAKKSVHPCTELGAENNMLNKPASNLNKQWFVWRWSSQRIKQIPSREYTVALVLKTSEGYGGVWF